MSRSPTSKALALGALLAVTTAGCAQITNLPRLKRSDLAFKLPQSSKIFASDGRLITTLHGTENRTNVSLEQIPKHLQQAVVAIEDERFYEHDGVDLRAVVRAALANAASGDIAQGGSTITQQYVKNVIIAPGETAARTLQRKLREAALARQLEKRLSKKEILERYLNTVYFGEGAYGVQAAAKTYFGKPVWKVTLREAAMLAGLIRAPEDYDPFERPNPAKARRRLVLRKMQQLGYIDRGDARQARRKQLGLQAAQAKDEYPAPYFVDYVQRLITWDPRFEAVGKTPEQRTQRLFQGGLRIHTTVDLAMQAAAEEAVSTVLAYPGDPHASIVAIDPTTGRVKAMVGGRDWFAPRKEDRFAKLNLAIVSEPNLGCLRPPGAKRCAEHRAPGTGRQAGSAFKPFALAAALDDGIPLSKTYSGKSPLVIPGVSNGEDYTVTNYEGGQYGEISLLDATVKSVNVVYAQVVEEVGPQAVVDTASAMGVTTPLEPYFSAALGTNEVNPLGMASAFGTFAANGIHHPPVAVTKIVDASGGEKEVIYQDHSEPEQAIDSSVAYLATTALQQVMLRGTGTGAQIGRPAAGKTGTAQEYRDAWFVGYTPDLVASVWVGYPEGQIEMKTSCYDTTMCRPTRITVTGGSWPASIWQLFMLQALSGVPASSFTTADIDLTTVEIDTRSGCLATKLTPDEFRAEVSYTEGTEPEEACREKSDGTRLQNVVGFPRAEAIRILEGDGFDVVTQRRVSTSYPPGVVVDQDPSGGSRVEKGTTVTLYISVVAREVPEERAQRDRDQAATVPSVLGFTEGHARSQLHNAGFEVRIIYQAESNPQQAKRRKGRVWKQYPAGGTQAKKGSVVSIYVNP